VRRLARLSRRLWCIGRGHGEVAAVSQRAPVVRILCRRCGRRRSLPLVGPPRQASIAEAVEQIRGAGVVLVDEQVYRELENGVAGRARVCGGGLGW
jgi:hypothetical protein